MAVVDVVLSAALAVPFAGGKLSPDMDQRKWWKSLDQSVPDELLFFGGPLRHRGITHWFGIPLILSILVAGWAAGLPEDMRLLPFLLARPLAGWWSHLVADFCIGARYRGGRRPARGAQYVAANGKSRSIRDAKTAMDWDDEPRGPGIPLAPWWWHVGLGYRNGTFAETVVLLISFSVLVGAVLAPVIT